MKRKEILLSNLVRINYRGVLYLQKNSSKPYVISPMKLKGRKDKTIIAELHEDFLESKRTLRQYHIVFHDLISVFVEV